MRRSLIIISLLATLSILGCAQHHTKPKTSTTPHIDTYEITTWGVILQHNNEYYIKTYDGDLILPNNLPDWLKKNGTEVYFNAIITVKNKHATLKKIYRVVNPSDFNVTPRIATLYVGYDGSLFRNDVKIRFYFDRPYTVKVEGLDHIFDVNAWLIYHAVTIQIDGISVLDGSTVELGKGWHELEIHTNDCPVATLVYTNMTLPILLFLNDTYSLPIYIHTTEIKGFNIIIKKNGQFVGRITIRGIGKDVYDLVRVIRKTLVEHGYNTSDI